ncbi:Hypothetical protein D9617_33g038710 [Elsinoe fawcettii]|nr:Hypothetical protein D9617_33g038710 [Elsinoe fawcettii]
MDTVDGRGKQGYEQEPQDTNSYTTGMIGIHNVVLVHLAGMGPVNAASIAADVRSSFPCVTLALVVGICGGVPKTSQMDIFLGDLILSTAIMQCDFGRQYEDRFERKSEIEDCLGRPNSEIRGVLSKLGTDYYQSLFLADVSTALDRLVGTDARYSCPGSHNDILFGTSCFHKHSPAASDSLQCECLGDGPSVCQAARQAKCSELGCDVAKHAVARVRSTSVSPKATGARPKVYLGRYGSGSGVIKSAAHRDDFARREGLIAFEMEGAGIWDRFPTIVVKAVCDYADGHKNKLWQKYAAGVAAAGTKALLVDWKSRQDTTSSVRPKQMPFDILGSISGYDAPRAQSHHVLKRYDNTTSWLLEECEFDKWVQSSNGTFLLEGIIGSGKSICTSTVIEHLRTRRSKNGTQVFHFYFDRGDNTANGNKETAVDVLNAFIKQMLDAGLEQPALLREKILSYYGPGLTKPDFEAEKVNMMFLWAKLILQEIFDECIDEASARHYLSDRLPRDLEETYARCLQKAESSSGCNGRKIIDTVFGAVEPFKLNELLEYLVIEHIDGTVRRKSGSRLNKVSLLECAANLVIYIEATDLILPVHHSARQFILTDLDKSQVELEIGAACLLSLHPTSTLIHTPVTPRMTVTLPVLPWQSDRLSRRYKVQGPVALFRRTDSDTVPEGYHFVEYANRSWITSNRLLEPQGDRKLWKRFHDMIMSPALKNQKPWPTQEASETSNIINMFAWAITNEHHAVIRIAQDVQQDPKWRKKKLDLCSIPIEGASGGTVLHYAARTGNESLFTAFHNAQYTYTKDSEDNTTFHLAALLGHDRIMDVIFSSLPDRIDDRDRRPKFLNRQDENPLHAAVHGENASCIRLAMAVEARLPRGVASWAIAEDANRQTAFAKAIASGYPQIISTCASVQLRALSYCKEAYEGLLEKELRKSCFASHWPITIALLSGSATHRTNHTRLADWIRDILHNCDDEAAVEMLLTLADSGHQWLMIAACSRLEAVKEAVARAALILLPEDHAGIPNDSVGDVLHLFCTCIESVSYVALALSRRVWFLRSVNSDDGALRYMNWRLFLHASTERTAYEDSLAMLTAARHDEDDVSMLFGDILEHCCIPEERRSGSLLESMEKNLHLKDSEEFQAAVVITQSVPVKLIRELAKDTPKAVEILAKLLKSFDISLPKHRLDNALLWLCVVSGQRRELLQELGIKITKDDARSMCAHGTSLLWHSCCRGDLRVATRILDNGAYSTTRNSRVIYRHPNLKQKDYVIPAKLYAKDVVKRYRAGEPHASTTILRLMEQMERENRSSDDSLFRWGGYGMGGGSG